MPSYLKDHGLTPGVATTALALIGLFNVFGTYAAGSLGGRLPKKLPAVGDLRAALARHRRLPAGAADAVERLRVRRGDGLPVALDRAAHQRHGRRRSSACATCRCSAASSSSATRSAASSASGSAAGSTTRPAATTSSGGSRSALGVFAALVNLPIRERRDRCARRRHEAGAAASPAWVGARAVALAAGLRRLPAARPRGRPRQPALELLLTRRRVGARRRRAAPPSPWVARWAHLIAPGGTRARRRLRQRPARALARGARPRASPRVDRDAAAMRAAARHRRDRRRRHRGRPVAARRPPLRRRGRHELPLAAAAAGARRRRSPPAACCSTRPSRAGNETRRQAVEARLPAAPGELLRRSPRVCASWPTKTAS